jgi:hypothetical protein
MKIQKRSYKKSIELFYFRSHSLFYYALRNTFTKITSLNSHKKKFMSCEKYHSISELKEKKMTKKQYTNYIIKMNNKTTVYHHQL